MKTAGSVGRLVSNAIAALVLGVFVCWCVRERTESAFEQVCALDSNPKFSLTSKVWAPPPEAIAATRLIAEVAGLSPNFEVLEGEFNKSVGAIASIRDNKRYIVFDTKDFDWRTGRARWRDVGSIAHEVGHHLGGHTAVRSNDDHAQELEADLFAGYVTGLLGATLAQALSWTGGLSKSDSKTHPGRDRRIEAVTQGWRRAEKLKQQRGLVCVPQWLGGPFIVNHEQCRMAWRCGTHEGVARACSGPGGQWTWRP